MQYNKKFRWFLNEDEGWHQAILQQSNELPELERVLTTVEYDDVRTKEERESHKVHFGKQREQQGKKRISLNREVDGQRGRREKDGETG